MSKHIKKAAKEEKAQKRRDKKEAKKAEEAKRAEAKEAEEGKAEEKKKRKQQKKIHIVNQAFLKRSWRCQSIIGSHLHCQTEVLIMLQVEHTTLLIIQQHCLLCLNRERGKQY